MNLLAIQIVDSPADAPNYARDSIDVRAATITKAVIVKNGTERGKPTVDFQIETMDGTKFVAMLTGDLVISLAQAVVGASKQ